jgi:hypothetical protein
MGPSFKFVLITHFLLPLNYSSINGSYTDAIIVTDQMHVPKIYITLASAKNAAILLRWRIPSTLRVSTDEYSSITLHRIDNYRIK